MSLSPLVLSLVLIGPAAQQPPVAPSEPAPPRITLQSASAPSVAVQYLNVPWGPNTFAAMERPGDSFYNRRLWPFAQLTTQAAFTLDGARLPPGRYALVFHPNGPDDEGMGLEVRRVSAEFLQAGNVMTPAPEGETVLRVPVRFETVADTAPALAIALAPDEGRTSLTIRYGDRRLVKELRH